MRQVHGGVVQDCDIDPHAENAFEGVGEVRVQALELK